MCFGSALSLSLFGRGVSWKLNKIGEERGSDNLLIHRLEGGELFTTLKGLSSKSIHKS